MSVKSETDSARLRENPSIRMLRAVEIIARNGPISYDALKADLGISKTATWRIVATLRDAGWVRLRSGCKRVELASRLDDLFATAHFSDAEFFAVADGLHDLADEHFVHFDLFTLDPTGRPQLLDTTRRLAMADTAFDEEADTLIFALRAAMTPQQLTRHFTKVLETAEPELADQIRSGAAGRRIKQVGSSFWHEKTLFVCLRGRMGTPATIRIEARDRQQTLPIQQAHAALRAQLSDKAEFRTR